MLNTKIKSFLVILLFVFTSIIFNLSIYKEFFVNKITLSDNITTEIVIETSYQNILHLKNPFILNSIFYPFTTNISLNDPAISSTIFFFFLRPFFTTHQSLIIITLLGFFLNNFLMYLLLIKLKIKQIISILVSLIFGFTPFLSHRVIGHYTYIPIYFFPLAYLIVNQFLETKLKKNKLFLSIAFGLFSAFVLLSNFYYFFMMVLGALTLIGYYIFFNRKKAFTVIFSNIKYLTTSTTIFCFSLIPWFISVYKLVKTGDQTSVPGFGGAITLSADVFNFFTPSEYNPIYKEIFYFLSLRIPYFTKYNDFFLNSWERFVYPGIIILGVYFSLNVLKTLKKFPQALWNKVKSYFYISLVFIVLMLGPFLKIFNRWLINLDGVAIVFPLPFLLFHYIPGLSSLRAPSRFAPAFVFFACVVIAYILDYLLSKMDRKKSVGLIITLFVVFFLDQFYVIPTQLNREIPIKIYDSIRNKPPGTVLEIPFTVRDGFQYMGFVHAIQPMAGQLIHKKPIIGGYIARVPDEIFTKYKKMKFINYLSEIIDKGNYMPLKEKPRVINLFPYPYPINTAENEVQSLNIKYVVLKTDEKYSNYLTDLFKQIGFIEQQKDKDYIFLER